MKIGFIIYGSLDTMSGGYLYDRKLVQYLREQGDMVEIISLPWRNYAAHLTDNLSFRFPPHLDILIQDELNHPSLIIANAKKRSSYPVISLVHHLRCSELRPKWQNAFYRFVERKYLQSVDGFIFNSQTTKSVVNETIDEKPSIVAYPPTDRFGKEISEQEIVERANKEPFRILFLGNVIYRKGLHTLLDALKDRSYRLDVAGSLSIEPKYVQTIWQQTSALGLQSSVFYHDALDNEPLIQLLRQSHLLIVPSSYEGFGIAYLEGMAFGLPAIGTTVGAASEIIEDGKTGYLIPPNDVQTLADKINSLASDRSLLVEMSINAVKRYRSQPKWEQTASQIRQFLLERLNK